MTELGQPLHAYDLERLAGGITVRAARPAERLTLLDDREYVLDPDFMVIADASGAIGLAGIMGGRGTAIGDATTEVLLESAHFAPAAVAGRARRLGLFTDAAQRFERGVDPSLPAHRARAGDGAAQANRGRRGRARADDACGRAGRDAEEWVGLRRSRLARLLGADVPG